MAPGIPRGRFIGTTDDPVDDESEHFTRCPACGGMVDMRDLGDVFRHPDGPHEKPAADA